MLCHSPEFSTASCARVFGGDKHEPNNHLTSFDS
uniref:Uncharacterized protein n=1 Tax=Siphoviridae sp. cttqT1 TaxID=2827961 RepID=A0A8S5TP21_9CAUD|nr:MAG TPA: hypothetical protein [Siphoviridae sp. cttqT1]